MRLQLTLVHGRHSFGLPGGEVAVEGLCAPKHWKKVVREETVFKHINNLLHCMSVTFPVSQLEMSPLKALAE